MSLLKYEDLAKMNEKERSEKLAELKFGLSKAGVVANRTNAKTKEIKKAVARILTFDKAAKGVQKKK